MKYVVISSSGTYAECKSRIKAENILDDLIDRGEDDTEIYVDVVIPNKNQFDEITEHLVNNKYTFVTDEVCTLSILYDEFDFVKTILKEHQIIYR